MQEPQDPKQVNISLREYENTVTKEYEVSFDDLIEAIKVCNFDWHMIDPESEEFLPAKQSYEKVASCREALLLKNFSDPGFRAKLNKVYNQHVPVKYQLP